MKAVSLTAVAACSCVLADPMLNKTRDELRNVQCERLTVEEAAARHPGDVPPQPAREIAGANVDVLTCSVRFLDLTERPARDEAILSTLSTMVSAITERATVTVTPGRTWYVDAFYPSPAVAQKISVAAKTLLAERGLPVSDRVPLLSAGDVAVLAKMPPGEQYRLACARAFATEALGPDDVFFGLILVDPRETQLHGGTCERGEWRWLP